MIDRYGSPIRVAWAEHEILWLEAAMSLPVPQRSAAYRDISELSGRTESAVRFKAGELRAARERASARMVMVPAMPFRRAPPKPKALPSKLRGPTKEQLMSGKARPSRHIFREAAE